MRPLVGLIPAAGRATRLALKRGSKEILPVAGPVGDSRPVIAGLLDAMGFAGVERAVIVLRQSKWDIPESLVRHAESDWPQFAYVVTPGTNSIPETVDLAGPWLQGSDVILGFPDVRFNPRNAVAGLLSDSARSRDDIALALFPSDRPDKTDMVEVDHDSVTGFRVKPGPSDLSYTWLLAAWGPRFTDFLSSHLAKGKTQRSPAGELQMSQVFGAALEAGLAIRAHFVADGSFIDVGTPEDLERAEGRQSVPDEGDP